MFDVGWLSPNGGIVGLLGAEKAKARERLEGDNIHEIT